MVTMADVAKTAGVSRATASYALRGDPRIIPSTAEKVRKAAHDLNYTANLSARSLRSGRNGIIGLAIFELDRPYPSEMSAAISKEAVRLGIQVIVQQTSHSKDSEIAILQKVTSQLCDGMIFSPEQVSNEELKALSGGKPIVLLDDISHDPIFDSVSTACEEGAESAVRHLIDIGCRHIRVIGSQYEDLVDDRLTTSVAGRRLIGCLKAFEDAGIAVDTNNFVPLTHWNIEHARQCAHDVATCGIPVDGVFCMTDTLALGFIRGLADLGVRVPDDVAVIGFDGINESEFSVPSLSTIRTDLDDLASKAVRLLLKRIDGDIPDEPQRLTANYELVQRESTRR